ncbi:MAG: 30S ribosomal protein S8 [Candidatus Shapirobacteria bacterium]
MNNYPLGNFLIILKNAHLSGKMSLTTPFSRIKKEVADLLVKSDFLVKAEVQKNMLSVELVSKEKRPFWQIKLYSKPGRRFYAGSKNIPYFPAPGGVVIMSTPGGIMSGREARKKNLGGEVIAVLW